MTGDRPQALTDLTQQQAQRRRQRSVAIALGLVLMVALFYVITLVRMAPGAAS